MSGKRQGDVYKRQGKDGKVTANGYFVVKGESISQTVDCLLYTSRCV